MTWRHRLKGPLMAAALLAAGVVSAGDKPDTPIPVDQPVFPPGTDFKNTPLEDLEKAYEGQPMPESVRMYLAIKRGSHMGIGEGWFTKAATPFTWEWLAQRHRSDVKDAITAEQFQGPAAWFNKLDRDHNGKITADDLDWSDENPWVRNAYLVNRMFRKIDPTGDGKLTRDEWIAFFDQAACGADALTSDQLRDAWIGGISGGFLPGDEPTEARLLQGFFAGDLGSLQEGPAVGSPAPDFALDTIDGKQVVRLSDLIGKKPVVLVLGNFTCGPFRSMYPDVESIRARFEKDAEFVGVLLREAHPTDGWVMQSNDRVGVHVAQPKTYGERQAVAAQCGALLKPTIPLLVDDAHDSVGHAYSGMPARLYVIDRAGNVVYKGGRGPFGFKAGEMEQALVMTLMNESSPSNAAPAAPVSHTKPRIEPLTNEGTWKRLPEASEGRGEPLPNWARVLVKSLPNTTAALIELDSLCRTTPQFSLRERGLIRRSVAQVNRCAYGLAYANADLRTSGLDDADLTRLDAGDLSKLDEREQRLVRYATQASKAARDLTDEQVEQLRKDLGDDRLVGLVLLTAYANFQDRLIHALAIPLEDGGPLLPASVKFATLTPGGSMVKPLDRPEIPDVDEVEYEHPDWSDYAFTTLQERLEKQRDREPRIAIPTWEEMMATLPKGLYNPERPLRIRWSRLVAFRQPQIGPAWIRTLRIFGNEGHQNRAFEESVFWVVTRDLRCFYCMGHCEMLMEVGGLSKADIADRTHRMAEGDWKDFTPAERAAFAMASEMTRTPWTVSDADFEHLKTALGQDRAVDAIFWISRCQFMTKVSDTFQLQLERDNVFKEFEPPKESPR